MGRGVEGPVSGRVTRGAILHVLSERGLTVDPSDLVYDREWGGYTIGGMDWAEWLDAMTMN